MMMKRKLMYNGVSSAFLWISRVIVYFLLTPVVLNVLGPEQFGIWSLITAISIFIMLFDGGLSQTLIRHISISPGTNQESGLSSRLIMIFVLFMVMVSIVGATAFLIFPFLSQLWTHGDYSALTSELFWLMIVCVSVNLPLSIFHTSLKAAHEYVAVNLIQATVMALTGGIAFWGMNTGMGLKGYAMCMFVAPIIGSALCAIPFTFKFRKHLYGKIAFDYDELKMLIKFSSSALWINLSNVVLQRSGIIILKCFSSLHIVGLYGLITRFSEMAQGAFYSVINVFDPAIRDMSHSQQTQLLRKNYLFLNKILLSGLLSTLGILCIFYDIFIYAWIGDAYDVVVWPGIILLAHTQLSIIFGASGNFLTYSGKQSIVASCTIANALVTVVAYLLLCRDYALQGVVSAPFIGTILVQGMFMFRYAMRALEISYWTLVKGVLKVVVTFLFVACGSLVVKMFLLSHSLASCILAITLSSMICMLCLYVFNFSRAEKKFIREIVYG